MTQFQMFKIITFKKTPSTANPSGCLAASSNVGYLVVFQCTKCNSPEYAVPSTVCSDPLPSEHPQWQWNCSNWKTSWHNGPPVKTDPLPLTSTRQQYPGLTKLLMLPGTYFQVNGCFKVLPRVVKSVLMLTGD